MTWDGSTPTGAELKKLLSAVFAVVMCAFFAAGFSPAALAHEPVFAGPQAEDPRSAPKFSDPSSARVVYFDLSRQNPTQWFALENDKPRELAVKVGVPAGVSRQPGDPTVVWFGPGLTEAPPDTRIEPPGNPAGAVVLPRLDDPEPFYEPVTGTQSRLFVDASVRLPSAGTYYVAVVDAAARGGKVWVGVGQQERCAWRDVTRLPKWIEEVRDFHEVPGWPPWAWIGTLSSLAAGTLAAWLIIRRLRRA